MNQSTQQPGTSERGPQSLYTPLSGSLRGIELVSSAHEIEESDFYAVVNTYPTEEWLKFDSNFQLKCGKKDTKKMARWARQFYHSLEVLWDNQRHNHIRGRVLPATTENLRELLARIEFREAPTLFYLSGHTEIKDQERTYLTSDCLQHGVISTDMTLRYSEMGRQLMSQESSRPLIWVTEVCDCDNFMKLPYVYWCEDGQVNCKETGFDWHWAETYALHFAATSPNQHAITFEGSSGAVYTNDKHNAIKLKSTAFTPPIDS
ncbi:hypothetical protein RHS04_07119 [Rhizoctonia solani]|uniref:Uncharacterized protein n=1 Tax=Rhizoctonia solani TaxID=456999 RepID=A0A8H7LHP1_9AGAM|nr:hypothetical protein RHS04_07119 [Rhizoctonia solani]